MVVTYVKLFGVDASGHNNVLMSLFFLVAETTVHKFGPIWTNILNENIQVYFQT